MKKLSDYQGEEAIELWADLIDPLTEILGDERVKDVVTKGKSRLDIAKTILKEHKKEATEILLRIDPTPINGLNILLRLIGLLGEMSTSEEIKSFFGFAEQVKTDEESSGLLTANTEANEN